MIVLHCCGQDAETDYDQRVALTSALQHHQLLTAESEGIWLEKEKL